MSRFTVHFSGHVQGVGFRYTTSRVSNQFLVAGAVKNLPDGRVELVVEGDKKELLAFVKAINEAMEGQVEGAVHMGLGYALTEEFPTDEEGRPTNMTLRSLDIIRPKDMPDVEVILVEAPQPDSPYGIKGVGEIGLVPTAGAVAEAYRQVDGRFRTHLPLKKHEPLELG